MSPYSHGTRRALLAFGLSKQANTVRPVPPTPSPEPEGISAGDLGTGAVTTGLAAAPFAGMIGQKPIIHDPLQGAQGAKYKNLHELARAAQTGDVLLTSKPQGSIWKTTISPFSGSEFYHAQPITHTRKFRGKHQGVTTSAGEIEPFPTMRTGLDLKDVPGRIPQELAAGKYPDALLMRPKKEFSKNQLKEFTSQSLERSSRGYDYGHAIKSWLRDIFVPKIPGLTDRGPQTICKGNVCSTVPSQALKDVNNIDVVPGKRARDVMPADFMRSENFELVGSHVNPEHYKTAPALRKAMPYLARGAMGAGLAGTGYTAMEHPEYAGAIPGAIAGDMAVTGLARKFKPTDFAEFAPSAFDAAESLMADPVTNAKYIKNFALRRAPGILAGAGLGAGVTYGLVNKYREMMGQGQTPEE